MDIINNCLKGEIKMQSDFNKGASYMRDIVLCGIIGKQNKIGNNESLPEYKVLQDLLVQIEREYGCFMQDFKG